MVHIEQWIWQYLVEYSRKIKMAAITITNSYGTVFTFSNGEVKNIECTISAQLDFDSMPMSTAPSAMLFDFNGITKVIDIQGELFNDGTNHTSAGSCITIDEQRQWLEGTMNGMQGGSVIASTYTSTWDGSSFISSRVLFSVFRHREEEGKPEQHPFQITLFVGSV